MNLHQATQLGYHVVLVFSFIIILVFPLWLRLSFLLGYGCLASIATGCTNGCTAGRTTCPLVAPGSPHTFNGTTPEDNQESKTHYIKEHMKEINVSKTVNECGYIYCMDIEEDKCSKYCYYYKHLIEF